MFKNNLKYLIRERTTKNVEKLTPLAPQTRSSICSLDEQTNVKRTIDSILNKRTEFCDVQRTECTKENIPGVHRLNELGNRVVTVVNNITFPM